MNPKDLGDLLVRRRSIRKFTKDPVPREALDRILEAGRWAPSGANRQPWLFVVVDDPEAKFEIRRHAELADKKWHARAPAWLKAFFDHYEITPTKEFLVDVPYLIVVFGERGFPYWRESAWLAIGNMVVAATAEGLGTLTYTPGTTGYLNRILQVEDRYVPLCILPIGRAAEAPAPEERPRKPIDQVVRHSKHFVRVEATPSEPSIDPGARGRDSFIPALGDSRVAVTTLLEIAAILQGSPSAVDLLPRLSRALTKLVPAKEVELVLQNAALRCEVGGSPKDLSPHAFAHEPKIEGGKVTVPLILSGRAFGALILERKEPFSALDLETLIDASRVVSLGIWSRFSQLPRA